MALSLAGVVHQPGPQTHRHHVCGAGPGDVQPWRGGRGDDAHPAGPGHRRAGLSAAGTLRAAVQYPWHHHGVLRGHALSHWADQLRHAAADRRPRRALSAAQCHQPLVDGSRRGAGDGLTGAGALLHWWLERLSALYRHRIPARRRPGLLDLGPDPELPGQHPHRPQLRGHPLQGAGAGHAPVPHVAVQLDRAVHQHPDDLRHAAADRGHPAAGPGPLPGLPLLHQYPGRQPDELHQPVLAVRPPGGVHPHPASLRGVFRGLRHLFHQASLWLSLAGLGHPGDRRALLYRVAAPLLHHGPEPQDQRRLRHRHHAHRHSHRGEDLRLDGNHVPRSHPPDHAADLRGDVHHAVRDRRPHRHHPGHTAGGLPGAQHRLPGRPLPQHADPGNAVRHAGRLPLLVSQGLRLPPRRTLGPHRRAEFRAGLHPRLHAPVCAGRLRSAAAQPGHPQPRFRPAAVGRRTRRGGAAGRPGQPGDSAGGEHSSPRQCAGAGG